MTLMDELQRRGGRSRTETFRDDLMECKETCLIPRLINAFQKQHTVHFCANARRLGKYVLSSARIKKKKQSAFYAIIKGQQK